MVTTSKPFYGPVDAFPYIVTRQNAEILGISNALGSLENGKWASFVCWNGDPFDVTSYPAAVYGESRLLFSD
jgi:imidazolonepropionase-like amidohydrolase